ncbi:hypothetical protein [Tenacibaculum sp. UWU-22]|uniref:hypothetical protein n=1 Tax=Tenacibaculum sp. UWU-22 TaxID=3234187 RepID=UPI0034DB285B
MEKVNLNVIPSYGYKIKIIGFTTLLLSLSFYLINTFFSLFKLDNRVLTFLVAVSLLLIVFSKEKNGSKNDLKLRYISGKISVVYFITFLLAVNFIEIITNYKYHFNYMLLIISFLLFYLILFYSFRIRFKDYKVNVEEISLRDNLIQNKKIVAWSVFLSIITLILLLIFK